MLAGLTLELYNGVLKQLQFLCSKFLDVTKIFRNFAPSHEFLQFCGMTFYLLNRHSN